MMSRKLLVALVAMIGINVHSATIVTEAYNVAVSEQFPELNLWGYRVLPEPGAKELKPNTELGEVDSIFIAPRQEQRPVLGEYTYTAWDFSVNGNIVHTLSVGRTWILQRRDNKIVIDEEVAHRTRGLLAAQVLGADIYYRHFVDRFSMSYMDPFVYFGDQEKKKYMDFFNNKNILIQSLAKSNTDYLNNVSKNIVTKNNWVSYSRHKIPSDQLAWTVEDPELKSNLVFVRALGESTDKYLIPGDNLALQERTISLKMDVKIHRKSMLRKITLNEPVLFTDLVTLYMACSYKSASETLDWLFSNLTTASTQPNIDGAHIVSVKEFLNAVLQCQEKNQENIAL
ncbi:hypothetical protein ACFOND_04680 [Reinekea marina]|uniref:Uncharacterized protein n=2 Tax=Reinekea marina TaxID=1310421 RepID=A0ABV7WRB2_9GAMM